MNMAGMQSRRCLSFVLYPRRPEPHLCKEYDESIRMENIGAIPLLPGHLDQLERRMTEIVGRTDAHARGHPDPPWYDGGGGQGIQRRIDIDD